MLILWYSCGTWYVEITFEKLITKVKEKVSFIEKQIMVSRWNIK